MNDEKFDFLHEPLPEERLPKRRVINTEMENEVMRALAVKPLWAWLIVNGYKDVENRTWPTRTRGKVYIHASASMSWGEYRDAFSFIREIDKAAADAMPSHRDLIRDYAGGVIGSVDIVGLLPPPAGDPANPWHIRNHYGFKLANARAFPAKVPAKGALSFFKLDPLTADAVRIMEKST